MEEENPGYPMMNGIHWRDTALPLRFFFFDARVLAALLVFAVHMSLVTFCIAVLGMLFFAALEFFGVTIEAFFRLVRTWPCGSARPVSFGYENRRRVMC